MATKTLTPADLAKFTGTENCYWHGLNRDVLFTDDARHVAEAGGAYWLLDEIALANRFERRVKAEEFQVWTLTRNSTGNGATLDCGDGNGNTVYSKRIPFTDFPVNTVKLFCEGGMTPVRSFSLNEIGFLRFPQDRIRGYRFRHRNGTSWG